MSFFKNIESILKLRYYKKIFVFENSDLFSNIRKNHKRYLDKINEILAKLNFDNNNYFWWAFNFTSKNPLNSLLISKLLDVFAIIDSIEKNEEKKYKIFGISPGQKSILESYFGSEYKFSFQLKKTLINKLKLFFSLIKTFCRIIITFGFFKINYRKKDNFNIVLFSFIDGINRSEKDPYFGNLIDKIKKKYPQKKIGYLFLLYSPFMKMKKDLINEKNNFNLLFSYLKINDFFWLLGQVFKTFRFKPKVEIFNYKNKNILIRNLIQETILEEISKGFVENLLVYRAFKRINKIEKIEKILYPFENKPIEKLMLIGIKNKFKTIGYQHTSITERHLSFKLLKNELNVNPLPDKIVTIGEVTRKWMIDKGNFNPSKIKEGVALRTNLISLKKNNSFDANKIKLLFVFSSSINEIVLCINFLQKVIPRNKIICRFRFHKHFPFYKLKKDHQNWVNKNIQLISDDSLQNDLSWTNMTLYISSSVALESLLVGKPIIWLDIDKLNSNPLLYNNIHNSWRVKYSKELINIIHEIFYLSDKEKKQKALKGKEFAESYMKPKKFFKTKTFL